MAKIKLDKVRNIKFTLNSLIKFEKITGINITQIGERSQDMEIILALIYVGIMHEDKDITMEQVGDLVTLDKLADINKALSEAISTVK